MLTVFAAGLLVVSLGPLCLSVIQLTSFLRYCRRFPRSRAADSQLPRAGVVLCIRGADETLADCLNGLLDQDYPHYSLSIVVDSKSDPGWELVQRFVATAPAGKLRVTTLRERNPESSLKCSAMVQGVEELDESHEIVAFIDADVVPHASWLRELAQPLLDAKVGATTGTRWCVPLVDSIGSIVRSV